MSQKKAKRWRQVGRETVVAGTNAQKERNVQNPNLQESQRKKRPCRCGVAGRYAPW